MPNLSTVFAAAVLCALPIVRTNDPRRVAPCPHRHPGGGVVATLQIAEHPRGAVAIVELCNATSRPIRVTESSFVWEESAVPEELGGARLDGAELGPGIRLSFEFELTQRFRLDPAEYYQFHYAGRFRADGSSGAVESNEAGFTLRLTD